MKQVLEKYEKNCYIRRKLNIKDDYFWLYGRNYHNTQSKLAIHPRPFKQNIHSQRIRIRKNKCTTQCNISSTKRFIYINTILLQIDIKNLFICYGSIRTKILILN